MILLVVQRAREYIATTVGTLLKVDALTKLAQQYATTYPGDLDAQAPRAGVSQDR